MLSSDVRARGRGATAAAVADPEAPSHGPRDMGRSAKSSPGVPSRLILACISILAIISISLTCMVFMGRGQVAPQHQARQRQTDIDVRPVQQPPDPVAHLQTQQHVESQKQPPPQPETTPPRKEETTVKVEAPTDAPAPPPSPT
eukprot:CAMPEP_0176240540 /NCGR_PEP_ID=MMETSP0121_2-20121125/29428_1 /TAXON_ID=160619 /ORGANISM="Kryptoperidinium foliaceum, Strain CCMP 1326" /LENGTH=143 /DNA_ID=CAMNT_0017580039 /DNA_START=27 /DNA_END=454 /DNA_ORIENTATION=-